MDRASACGALGRGFESLRIRYLLLNHYSFSLTFSDLVLSHMCIFPRNKNEPTIIVTRPTTTNIKPLPIIPNFDIM